MRFRDCDALVTKHGFIFYVVGYEHHPGRAICNLKYIPEDYARYFNLEWLDQTWRFKGRRLVRPKVLFSHETYRVVVEALRSHFPEYVYYSKRLGKYLVSVPEHLIEEVYRPDESLARLLRKAGRDELENKAVELVLALSERSGVSLENFGVSGSISLGMHGRFSDIDVIVYGARNYLKVLEALRLLEEEGRLSLSRDTPLDRVRLNRGRYGGVRFNVNAVRAFSEIPSTSIPYVPVSPVKAVCKVIDDSESMFRPAVYGVEVVEVLEGELDNPAKVSRVVSMIGLHRMIARAGDEIVVKGVLERAALRGGEDYRIFVGSGLQREYIVNLSRGVRA